LQSGIKPIYFLFEKTFESFLLSLGLVHDFIRMRILTLTK
jgi:hypothetical protein